MKLAMAAVVPYAIDQLRVVKQIGVDHLVYYDMATMPVEYDDLRRVVRELANLGLSSSVVECGPPIDRIILGKDGREEQIKQFEAAIANMGRLGIGVLCYTFMPPRSRRQRNAWLGSSASSVGRILDHSSLSGT